mmetsp:Transcript_14394/g.30798  ORF Transcript_14394/g.30798 Transcript_14394/m.30798 type:complete len:260 (+) Transcript_14394:1006-1785(+)
MRTVPLASVALASIPHPKTTILASVAEVSVVSRPRRATNPWTTWDCVMSPPRILATRTESTEKDAGPEFGIVPKHASATRGAKTSSEPRCFAANTGLTTRTNSSLDLPSAMAGTSSANGGKKSSINLSPALLKPDTTSDGCNPIRNKSSVCESNSPAKLTTKFVPSPHSKSCASAANCSIFAAGCSISNSFTMVAQSDVTMILPRWLTTSLFIPLGPRDVRVMVDISRHASTLRMVAPSRPSMDWWPCLSMPPRPAAWL